MYDRADAESPRAPFWRALPGASPRSLARARARSCQISIVAVWRVSPSASLTRDLRLPRLPQCGATERISTGVTMPLAAALKGLSVAEEARASLFRPAAASPPPVIVRDAYVHSLAAPGARPPGRPRGPPRPALPRALQGGAGPLRAGGGLLPRRLPLGHAALVRRRPSRRLAAPRFRARACRRRVRPDAAVASHKRRMAYAIKVLLPGGEEPEPALVPVALLANHTLRPDIVRFRRVWRRALCAPKLHLGRPGGGPASGERRPNNRAPRARGPRAAE